MSANVADRFIPSVDWAQRETCNTLSAVGYLLLLVKKADPKHRRAQQLKFRTSLVSHDSVHLLNTPEVEAQPPEVKVRGAEG